MSGGVGNSRRHVLSCRGSFISMSFHVSWPVSQLNSFIVIKVHSYLINKNVMLIIITEILGEELNNRDLR